MINSCKSKVFCRVDNCKNRHQTLLNPINKGNNENSASSDTTQNYETKQHITIGLKDQTPELPQQSEASKHIFLHTIPVKLPNGHTFIETNALLDCVSDTNLLRKDIAKRLNLKEKQKKLSVTNALSKSHNIDSVSFDMCRW